MSDHASIPGSADPFALFRAWMAEAEKTEPSDPNAIALATVDAAGLPNVRIVLLKEIEDDAFVFYTNYDSAKGRELAHHPQASFVCHWKTLRRQVRVRGFVAREDGPQADAYYASRGIGSRLGAWASQQSRPLDSRETLIARLDEARDRFKDAPPRPPFWGGFRLIPVEIEFWVDGADRLHDRFAWSREASSSSWYVKRLFP